MYRRIKENTYLPIVFLGCLQPFIQEELFSILGITLLVAIIFYNRLRFKLSNSLFEKGLFLLFALGAVIGLTNLLQSDRAYFRDFYYYLNPIIFILIGINITKDNQKSYKRVLYSLVLASLIASIICTFQMFFSFSTGKGLAFREYFEYVMWGDAISIGIMLALWEEITTFLKRRKICFIILVLVILLGLSRTVWIETLILVLSVLFVGQNKLKAIKRFAGIGIIFIVLLFVSFRFLSDVQIHGIVDKLFNSLIEINYSNDFSSASAVQSNWRGYEMSCAISQFKDSPIAKMIIGGGFGTGIFVGSYARFVGQIGTEIFVIHNGFLCMLIKDGIIGLAIYITIYIVQAIKCFKRSAETHLKTDGLVFGVIICLMIYTYLVKGIMADFVQYNALILLGSWLYVNRYKGEKNRLIQTNNINICESKDR